MKFDIILTNPPFNLGEKMLIKWFDLADEICTVQPSTWLLGKKKTKSICSHLDSGEFTADIESINGNEFFDTGGIGGVMAVQFFEKNALAHNEHYVKFDGKEYTKTDDISLTSNDELIDRFNEIVQTNNLSDNVLKHVKYNIKATQGIDKKNHYEYNPKNDWYVIQLPRVRGNKDQLGNKKSDFYTLISNDIKFIHKKVLGQYKELDPLYYIAFDTKYERDNCFNYFQTDFVRACLIKYKMNIELINNPHLTHIPWFDFSDQVFSKYPSEIDDYLFNKYNISDEIRKHIENLLPDYYSIRNKN